MCSTLSLLRRCKLPHARICFSTTQFSSSPHDVSLSPSSRNEVITLQNELFSAHRKKVMAEKVPRIEKIEVQYKGRNLANDGSMLMNKGLSTPHHCAMHISHRKAKESVLALIRQSDPPESQDGKIIAVRDGNSNEKDTGNEVAVLEENVPEDNPWIPWDMHRPLPYNCELKLLKFDMSFATPQEAQAVNRAYWKSCALVLGATVQEAFEEAVDVKLAHLPNISQECGAFCYDVKLSESLLGSDGVSKWQPDENVLVALTKTARKLITQNLTFERLEVTKDEAFDMFHQNDYMLQKIENSVFDSVYPDFVPLYRFGPYIDICDGPLIPSTSVIYHFVVSAVHQLRRKGMPSNLWRFQGLSLPKELQVHHAIWAMLEHRSRNLVTSDLPYQITDVNEYSAPLHKYESIENKTKSYNIATGQWLQDRWDSTTEKIKVKTN